MYMPQGSYFPPVFGPHAYADPAHLTPMYSDPSPGFNAEFLLQPPSMRKGSSTFSADKNK